MTSDKMQSSGIEVDGRQSEDDITVDQADTSESEDGVTFCRLDITNNYSSIINQDAGGNEKTVFDTSLPYSSTNEDS